MLRFILSHYDWKVLLQIIGINYFIFAEGNTHLFDRRNSQQSLMNHLLIFTANGWFDKHVWDKSLVSLTCLFVYSLFEMRSCKIHLHDHLAWYYG